MDSNTEVQLQLAQLTKQVSLLIIHATINKEKYCVCSELGHGAETYPYQEEASARPK